MYIYIVSRQRVNEFQNYTNSTDGIYYIRIVNSVDYASKIMYVEFYQNETCIYKHISNLYVFIRPIYDK